MTDGTARRVRAVVFDLDGTLVDTMRSAPQAYVDTIRALGGPVLTRDELVAIWNLGPTQVVLAHALGRAVTAADIDCYFEHFAAAMADVRPFPGIVDMLDKLTRHGYLLGVFTGATRRAATLMLDRAGIAETFSIIVAGDEVGQPKPAPVGLQLACHALRASPAEAAYVGDADVDLSCAAAAGSLGVRAAWGQSGGYLGGAAGRVGPMVVRHPRELPDVLVRPNVG
ncbi:HAD family hydrolase [Actinopolymorpha alba]|uniref:HAD family hydrolase n=1 Tax=Actinopolymorpha alba TaxID=533267 RepID=UPI0003778D52|nr:HAD family hydrolase [Actinopolymorpha alba]